VVLTNKTPEKDLKVWYRLAVKDSCESSAINVPLYTAARKARLYAKNCKIVETLTKIDPTKPFFLRDIKDLRVELDASVRNEEPPAASAAKRVHYAGSHDIGVGGDDDPQDQQDWADDRGEGAEGYMRYQDNPQYDGYAGGAGADEENLMGLLNLKPQQLGDGKGGDDDDDDSTRAVQNQKEHSQDEIDDLDDDQRGGTCSCGLGHGPGAFSCEACGAWLGGTQ
jgi:hypothetical protein